MGRAIRYAAFFAASAFLSLLALQVATLELPPLHLSGTPTEQARFYAGMYVGFAAGVAVSSALVILGGMVGSGVAFWLALKGKLRPWVILATGAVFAIATFLLRWPAIQLVGELPWLMGVVVIAGALSYTVALLLSPHAA
jgi:hypothetical protein